MDKRQIMQDIFGDQSDEESASSHEIEQQPEFNSDEDERGSELTNDAASSQQVEIDCGYLDGGAISSSSSDEEAKREKQTVTEQGIKAVSDAELNHDAKSTWYNDEGVTCEDKSTLGERVRTEGGTELNDGALGLDCGTGCSSLIQSENSNLQLQISEAIHSLFGDSDCDELAQDGADHISDQEKDNSVSREHKSDSEKDLESEGTVSCEQAPSVPENRKADDNQEEQSVCRVLVLEIPKRTPHGDPSQVARSELPNLIGFDDKPFDPETYVEQECYVTDASGTERLIPPTNIIHWRNIINNDGTTSVQSNARIVDWSDGSSQLLIGNEAFDITEEDTTRILSRASLWNEGIYQTLRKIIKSMKDASSSSASNPKSSTTPVDHQNTTPVPERVEDQLNQADPQTTEDRPARNLNKNDEKVILDRNVEESELRPSDKQDVNPEVRKRDRRKWKVRRVKVEAEEGKEDFS